jgi:hypothetical protein
MSTTSGTSSKPVISGQDVLNTITAQIREGLEDLSAVVVITAKADMNSEIKLSSDGKVEKNVSISAKLLAMTRLGLDGDIVELIPAENIDAQTRAEIMRIHDKNVETGINNWNNFVDGILKIVRIAADLADKRLPNSFGDAGKVITIPSSLSSISRRQPGSSVK